MPTSSVIGKHYKIIDNMLIFAISDGSLNNNVNVDIKSLQRMDELLPGQCKGQACQQGSPFPKCMLSQSAESIGDCLLLMFNIPKRRYLTSKISKPQNSFTISNYNNLNAPLWPVLEHLKDLSPAQSSKTPQEHEQTSILETTQFHEVKLTSPSS